MPSSPTARDAAEGLAEIEDVLAEHRAGRISGSLAASTIGLMFLKHQGPLLAVLRSAGTEGGETQGAVEMRKACLRLCNSALYGAPSTWPGDFPHGWKPPLSWDPSRAPTPEEAALHDNGVTDAWIAILTGTRDEQGNPRVPRTPALLNRVGGGGESGGGEDV